MPQVWKTTLALDWEAPLGFDNLFTIEGTYAKDINAITGYIRGGCTAIGMKKQFVTRVDESAILLETMIVSGGRIGSQIELAPDDLCRASAAEYSDLVRN